MNPDDIKTPEGWIEHSLSMEGNERASAALFDLDKIKLGAVLGKEMPTWSTRNAPVNPYD